MSSALITEAHRALIELRRVRDLFAKLGDPAEAERINRRILALKTAIEEEHAGTVVVHEMEAT